MLSRFVLVFAAVVGVGVLYALRMRGADDLMQSIAVELYGAALVAAVTAVLVRVPKARAQARVLLSDYQLLFSFVSADPSRLPDQLIGYFRQRADTARNEFSSERLRERFDTYVRALAGFEEFVRKKGPQYVALNYRTKWNLTREPLMNLLRALDGSTGQQFAKEMDRYQLSGAEHADGSMWDGVQPFEEVEAPAYSNETAGAPQLRR